MDFDINAHIKRIKLVQSALDGAMADFDQTTDILKDNLSDEAKSELNAKIKEMNDSVDQANKKTSEVHNRMKKHKK